MEKHKKNFFIFGRNISHSFSPALHNAGFAALGLPHRYSIFVPSLSSTMATEEEEEEKIIQDVILSPLLSSPSSQESEEEEGKKDYWKFGGGSVTFPFKVFVKDMLLLQQQRKGGGEKGGGGGHCYLTKEAEGIGAVNTVVVVEEEEGEEGEKVKRIVGDNTDWIGIKRCILGAVAAKKVGQEEGEEGGKGGGKGKGMEMEIKTAVVLGAGGAARAACYALLSLGGEGGGLERLVVVNRTRGSAERMVDDLGIGNGNGKERGGEGGGGCKVEIYENLAEAVAGMRTTGEEDLRVIVACIPADDLGEDKIPEELFSSSGGGGVLVEMAYRPQVTGMMVVARRFSSSSASSPSSPWRGWEIVRGTDILEEQAFAQFELWTGRKAPVEEMRRGMRDEARRRERERGRSGAL